MDDVSVIHTWLTQVTAKETKTESQEVAESRLLPSPFLVIQLAQDTRHKTHTGHETNGLLNVHSLTIQLTYTEREEEKREKRINLSQWTRMDGRGCRRREKEREMG